VLITINNETVKKTPFACSS